MRTEGTPAGRTAVDLATQKVGEVKNGPNFSVQFCSLGFFFHFLHPGDLVLNNDPFFLPFANSATAKFIRLCDEMGQAV